MEPAVEPKHTTATFYFLFPFLKLWVISKAEPDKTSAYTHLIFEHEHHNNDVEKKGSGSELQDDVFVSLFMHPQIIKQFVLLKKYLST